MPDGGSEHGSTRIYSNYHPPSARWHVVTSHRLPAPKDSGTSSCPVRPFLVPCLSGISYTWHYEHAVMGMCMFKCMRPMIVVCMWVCITIRSTVLFCLGTRNFRPGTGAPPPSLPPGHCGRRAGDHKVCLKSQHQCVGTYGSRGMRQKQLLAH